jgi:hypothetical protein
VNQFVEDCRNEWKRLGVPEPVADEMAAELAADLAEAEAEGASVEDVLGIGASDPRGFARAWARERGLIGLPPFAGRSRGRRLLLAATIGAFALVAIAGAVLLIRDSPSRPTRLAADGPVVIHPEGALWVRAPAVSPDRRIVVVSAPLPTPGALSFSVDTDDAGFDARLLGSILLSVGLTGLVLLSLVALARPRSVTNA